MKASIHALCAGLIAAAAVMPVAAQPNRTDDELTAVAAAYRAQNPGTRIDSVQRSPIPGLFEVVMGRNIAYMDASGRFALFGHIWDMQGRRDLTADRKALLDRVDTSQLDKSLAIKHVKGRGTREVFVFADPQCGFCKQQEQALTELDDITVYTFVLPVLGPESKRLASAVHCAAQPDQAWSALMLQGRAPAAAQSAASCGARSDAIEQIARGLGIASTPTLIAADGRKNAGALGSAQLAAWLAASPPQPVAANADKAAAVTR